MAMSSARVGTQFLEEHDCRYWGVRVLSVFSVKGNISPKEGRTGKEIAICRLASQLM